MRQSYRETGFAIHNRILLNKSELIKENDDKELKKEIKSSFSFMLNHGIISPSGDS